MAGVFFLREVKDCVDTKRYLHKLEKQGYLDILNAYGQKGVEALSQNTPKDSGKTAASWTYTVKASKDGATVEWSNTNLTKDGDPIAILLQYGHGTGTGGYVAGRDYINPAIQPIFDEFADQLWKVVTE